MYRKCIKFPLQQLGILLVFTTFDIEIYFFIKCTTDESICIKNAFAKTFLFIAC